jgi:adenylylsulfate kinase-like enzyme
MGVIWITGLAGAGKSSIAGEVATLLRARASNATILLDGDAVRAAFGDDGYDRASRLAAAYRISRLAQLIAAQEATAVVATMSLFHEIHAFNRSLEVAYFEVFVRCSEATLRQRSPLYAQSNGDEVVGRGIAAEFPRAPHLVVHNDDTRQQVPAIAQRVVNAWIDHVGIR